jgi:hypothetical protein
MLFFGRKKEEKPKESPKEEKPLEKILYNLSVDRSFKIQDVERTRSKLRVTGTEKEILSDVLTRVYEASSEGMLTPTERDQLISKYQRQLSSITSDFEHSEKLLSLHELEESRSELVKMFQDKFNELNVKIEEIRKRVDIKPGQIMSVKLPPVTSPTEEKATETKLPTTEKPTPTTHTPTPTPRRTKADDTLERLRKDLQKELEKLEQIEMEG